MSDAHNLGSDTTQTCEKKSSKIGTDDVNEFQDSVEDLLSNEMEDELEDEYFLQEEYTEEINDVYEFPLFDGKANMAARTRLHSKKFDIWAEVSAVCGDGTLISASGKRDHLWLGFVDQKAVLHWDAGSGPMELRSGRVKTDGRSEISARRYKKDAVLKLGSTMARGTAHGRMNSLDVDPFIYIGFTPENVTRLLGSTVSGFVGCIHRLRIDGRDVIPPAKGLTVTSHGLLPCTPHNLAHLVCP